MSWSRPLQNDSRRLCILEMLEGRPNAVVLGHSFIRRINRVLQHQIDYMGMRGAINAGRAQEGRVIASLMNLSRMYNQIHFRYTPLILQDDSVAPHDMESEFLAISVLRPAVLLFCLAFVCVSNFR